MASPMFGNQQINQQQQQAVYQQTQQQRPAKSVRVLPPVSSPMQQVREFYRPSLMAIPSRNA